MARKLTHFLWLVLGVLCVGKGWHWAKDGFSIQRTRFPLSILTDLSFSPEEEVFQALDQTYFYLGRGHQCYAFESEDGQYVLKLPRYDRYTLPFWLRVCPFSFREALRQDKTARLHFLLRSFRIAWEELREETALLYLHFHKTSHLQASVIVKDRLSRRYFLDLDQTAFLLQRKKPLMMPAFQKALTVADRVQAKKILTAFLDVIAIRAKKGIFNKDPSFLRNFGYDGVGTQIDIGSFYRKPHSDPAIDFAPSFLQTVGHVQNWLNTVDPEIATWFQLRTEEMAQ